MFVGCMVEFAKFLRATDKALINAFLTYGIPPCRHRCGLGVESKGRYSVFEEKG